MQSNMKKQGKGPLISLVFIALLILGRSYYFQPDVDQGEKAPDLVAELLNGDAFDLQQLKGRYVLVDFWGSWCAPCRRENPSLVNLFRKFKGQSFKNASGFDIVSVAIDKDEAALKYAIRKDGLSWPYHVFDEATSLRFFNGPISNVWGINEVPQKFLISPEGTIALTNPSVDELDSFLNTHVSN